jgi:DNA-binding NarL/FixJ family response regulator
MADKIHVLIADDHAIVRQGLRLILSETDDLLVAGEAEDGSDALILARQQHWDVYLLDVTMPNRDGIDTLKQLKKEFPRLPVLILSMHPEEQYAVRALKAGASGYLNKQSAPEQLVTAIRQVAKGKKYVSPAVAQQLGLAEADWSISFQSRVGTARWVGPYTDTVVRELAQRGIKQLDVACPGFAIDCLETIDEMGVEAAEIFHEAGGAELRYIPALNDSEQQVAMLAGLVWQHARPIS